jgi:stringent starvation protein B
MKPNMVAELKFMQDFTDGPKDNVVRVNFEKNIQSVEHRLLSEKKRQLFEQWLAKGLVTVLLDARVPGVKVPEDFKQDGDLRLNFSFKFQIIDFNFDNNAIKATLSFEAGPFLCEIPWSSVYGLQSAVLNQGAVWFKDFPSDYDQELVLGFNEEEHECLEDSKESLVSNVIEYDFAGKKDLVK